MSLSASTIPNRQFKLVLVDLPWKTETWSDKGLGRSPERHYATMDVDECCAFWAAMNLDRVVHRNVWLAMWTTPPHLENAFKVLHAWSFTYSTVVPWIKTARGGQPVAGTGKVSRGVHEPLIIAKRGSPRVHKPLGGLWLGEEDLSLILQGRRRQHSQKPEGLHHDLERAFSGPGLELFARGTARPNWHLWGDQVGLFEGSGT